jgi:hypothetical protein
MKKIVRLTESDLLSIVKRVINEQSEQSKKLYASWANKKSGNPEGAMSIMDDVLKFQRSLPTRDFAKYSSYDELKKDLDKVITNQKEKDATKIYEDKDLLVIQANTWEASCKYGAGTKWCTAGKDTPSNWERYYNQGTEFIWIFKNKPMNDREYKYSYHVKFAGENDWCDSLNRCLPTSRLEDNSYPKMHPKYDEIIEKLQSINDAKPDPNKEKNYEKRLINHWIESNIEVLQDKLFSHEQLQGIWEDEWYEAADYILNYRDGFEDVDEEEYENAVYELEDEGPGEINDNLIDFDERDLFFDVQNAARTYCRENNMDYTAENLERIIPELTIEYVEEVTNFETMVETITEDIKDRAHSDFENRLRYMVDAL